MAGDFQPRELSGSAFPNDRKTQPNHPDYKGSCLINGVEYWISGWVKTGARGKWLSLAFQEKEARNPDRGTGSSGGLDEVPVKAQQRPKPNFDDLGDDIPF